MTGHRTSAFEAAAQEFSAEQIAQLASEEAMRRVAALQAQLDALQRENIDLRQQRQPGSVADRGIAAELGTFKQEVVALRAENARLRDQQTPAAAQTRGDPVLQTQLSALRRENAALRAQRLVNDRLASSDPGKAAGTKRSKLGEGRQQPNNWQDVAAPAEEVNQVQRLLGTAIDVARRHESEAQRLAAEVPSIFHGCTLVCLRVNDLTMVLKLRSLLQIGDTTTPCTRAGFAPARGAPYGDCCCAKHLRPQRPRCRRQGPSCCNPAAAE